MITAVAESAAVLPLRAEKILVTDPRGMRIAVTESDFRAGTSDGFSLDTVNDAGATEMPVTVQ